MDPNEALREFLDCIRNYDYEGASEAKEHLISWMAAGGFAPKLSPSQMEYMVTTMLGSIGI